MSKYSQFCKVFFVLPLACAALLLTACVPSAVNMMPPVTSQTPLTTDGIVVARVINAGGSLLPFNQFTITPKGLNESAANKSPRLTSLPEVSGSSSLFISAVPAGEYSVDSVRAFYVIGESFYSLWGSGGVDLGVFNVVPGKITDLGTFIYYRKVDGDKYSDRLIRIPQTDNRMFIQTYRPFLKYDTAAVQTWVDDGSDTERFSNYVALAQNPTLFSKRYLSASGSLFLLGKLGSILERTPTGDWNQEMLETNSDLNTIAQNARGDLLVGGEQGALFYKTRAGQWQDLSLSVDTEIGAVQWLSSDDAMVYSIQNEAVTVWRGNPALAKVNWTKKLSYIANQGWRDANGQVLATGEVQATNSKSKSRVKNVRLESFLGADYVRIGVQRAGFDNQFDIFDAVDQKLFSITANQQLTYTTAVANNIDRIIPAGNVSLGVDVAGFWSWTGKDAYHRYDAESKQWIDIKTSVTNCPGVKASVKSCKINGKTMRRTSGFDFISTPVFVSPLKGFASVRPTLVGERTPYLAITSDGGQSWMKLAAEYPGKYCTDMVPEVSDRIMLYCGGVSGDFYESLDEGKTWRHVRQHQIF